MLFLIDLALFYTHGIFVQQKDYDYKYTPQHIAIVVLYWCMCLYCNKNLVPSPPGLILATKSGPPLPISIPLRNISTQQVQLDECIVLLMVDDSLSYSNQIITSTTPKCTG